MTTIQFDRYVPESWLDQGLSIAVPLEDDDAASGGASPRPKKGPTLRMRTALSASVIAIGMALTSLPFVAPSFGVIETVEVTEPTGGEYYSAADEVKPGRWGELVALLRSTPELAADDTSGDPKPLA